MKIGRDQRLQDPEIRPLLPNHHTIISELTGLTNEELKAAVEAEVVHPEMKRAALTNWVKDRRGERRPTPNKDAGVLPKGIHLGIRLPANMPEEAVERFEEELLTVCEAYGTAIVYPRTRIAVEQREQKMRARRYNQHLVREARKIVRETKRRQLKGRTRWPYAPEETRIDGPDEQQIRYALEIIGRGDEFDRIRNKAMQEL